MATKSQNEYVVLTPRAPASRDSFFFFFFQKNPWTDVPLRYKYFPAGVGCTDTPVSVCLESNSGDKDGQSGLLMQFGIKKPKYTMWIKMRM